MARGVKFSCQERRIRYIFTYYMAGPRLITIIYYRCFPHIVNLAVQAVLSSITNMNYAKEDANQFNVQWSSTHDVIASLRTLINKVFIPLYTSKKYTPTQKYRFVHQAFDG